MGLGGIILGAGVGVLAVAAAPFTGGGSLFGAATLVGSLSGAGLAAGVAGAVGGLVGEAAEEVMEDEKIAAAKKAREGGFKDGINEGKKLTADEIKRYTNFYLATTALSFYVAKIDGFISEEELLEINYSLDSIRINCDMPDWVKNKLDEIEKSNLSWDVVVDYLDEVGIDTLKNLKEKVDRMVEADGKITPEEYEILDKFAEYLKEREGGRMCFLDKLME